MPTELGLHNPRLERVRELRTARGRRDQGRFAIEGSTLIAEARRSGRVIRELYAAPGVLAGHPGLAALESAALPIFNVPRKAFERLSDLETPTGLLAILDTLLVEAATIVDRPGTIVVLAGINDPGNAGTLVRSAEAFGATGVLFGTGSVDALSPKVVRAAMGSLFRVPVASVDAAWLVAAATAAGRLIVAADTTGEDVRTVTLPANIILAIGNERRGVADWLPHFDRTVCIPQQGAAESLNAAVAGSIVLYALSRPG